MGMTVQPFQHCIRPKESLSWSTRWPMMMMDWVQAEAETETELGCATWHRELRWHRRRGNRVRWAAAKQRTSWRCAAHGYGYSDELRAGWVSSAGRTTCSLVVEDQLEWCSSRNTLLPPSSAAESSFKSPWQPTYLAELSKSWRRNFGAGAGAQWRDAGGPGVIANALIYNIQSEKVPDILCLLAPVQCSYVHPTELVAHLFESTHSANLA